MRTSEAGSVADVGTRWGCPFKARRTAADVILFGVFIHGRDGEVVNPGKTVFCRISNGCSLADSCDAKQLANGAGASRRRDRATSIAPPRQALVDIICRRNAVRVGIRFRPTKVLSYPTKPRSMGETKGRQKIWAGRVLDAWLFTPSDFRLSRTIPTRNRAHPEMPACRPVMADEFSTEKMVASARIAQRAVIIVTEAGCATLQKELPTKFHPRPYRLLPLQRMQLHGEEHAGESRRSPGNLSPEIILESVRKRALCD